MEYGATQFYEKAAERATDVGVQRLLDDLAIVEKGHGELAQKQKLTEANVPPDVSNAEDATSQRMFVLQYVQPGPAVLMDGSVSTLALSFAAAFATHNNWDTFLVGLAASVGAGISMAFAEALSDDGSLTGRGAPRIPRDSLWPDDDARGPRPHHALPCAGPVAKRILDRDRHFRDRCLLRALGYRQGARPSQGHALPSAGVSGHYWWRAGADRGNPDRRILIRQLHSNVTEVALGGSRGASRRTPRNSAWRASSCGSALGC